MHPRSLALSLACALACAGEHEVDPLDPDVIRELSIARGSAVGNAHGGSWSFAFELDTCDCPSIEFDGQTQDLCELGQFVPGELQVTQADGRLAITIDPLTLTGAVESDGSFIVASQHDISTLLGPLESLARIDGTFHTDGSSADGKVAQRLLGDLAGDSLDCRWTGSFVAERP